MDTLQIEKVLKQNALTRKCFLGVFSSDQLPTQIRKYPAAFIANVDTSEESGTHWLAFYMADRYRMEFFDSFGHAPTDFPGYISDYTKTFRKINFNPMTLQSNKTAVCGQYCIYYIYSRCRGRSLKDIVSSFVPKQLQNDVKIYNYVTKYFHVRAPFYQ